MGGWEIDQCQCDDGKLNYAHVGMGNEIVQIGAEVCPCGW